MHAGGHSCALNCARSRLSADEAFCLHLMFMRLLLRCTVSRRLESCNIVLDLVESHRLDLHFDHLLNTPRYHINRKFSRVSALQLRRLAGRTQCAFSSSFALKSHAPRATGRVSVGIQGLKRYLADDRGLIQIRSFTILLFDLIMSSSETCISLKFMNFSELSSTFTVSEVQPLLTCRVSFSNSFCAYCSEKPVAASQQTHRQLCQCSDSAGS